MHWSAEVGAGLSISNDSRAKVDAGIAAPVRGGERSQQYVFVPQAYQCQGTNVGEMGTLRAGNGHLTGGVPFVVYPQTVLGGDLSHTLTKDGHDASEDGTGRGWPAVVVPAYKEQVVSEKRRCPMVVVPAVGFGSKDSGNDAADEMAPTLRAMNHDQSWLNGFGQAAVTYRKLRRAGKDDPYPESWQQDQISNTLNGYDNTGQVRATTIVVYPEDFIVRRLTPTECERLQGMPEIRKSVTISVCQNSSGPRSNHALADDLSPKLLRPVGDVENDRFAETAPFADESSMPNALSSSERAVLRVLVDYERKTVRLHSRDRNGNVSVSTVAENSGLRQAVLSVASALLCVPTLRTQETVTTIGEEESRANNEPFGLLSPGNIYVQLSGDEIVAHANAAVDTTKAENPRFTSTTSPVGRSSPSYGSSLRTLCCSVAHVIASSTPEVMLDENSFDIEIDVHHGWTALSDTGKEISDSRRGQMIGNSVAVPCFRWLAERMASVFR